MSLLLVGNLSKRRPSVFGDCHQAGNDFSVILTERVSCNQCDSPHTSIVAQGTDREYFSCPDIFWIKRCMGCGLVYLSPRPQASELGRIYPPGYHSYAMGGRGPRQRAAKLRFRRIILDHFKNVPFIRLLDVGCGNGWHLDLARAVGPRRIDTVGIDIDERAVATAQKHGHIAFAGRFEDVHLDRQFDLITMTHVIEHLSDPQAAVAKAARMLNPGGVLAIETPNIGSWEYRRFKAHWGAYHIPRHWTFYDRDSIQSLGELEGLKLVDWYCHPGPTHWVWTMHNIALSRKGWPWHHLDRMFDPIAIFKGGLWFKALLAAFWCLDRAALALGRQTSVMTALFRKG